MRAQAPERSLATQRTRRVFGPRVRGGLCAGLLGGLLLPHPLASQATPSPRPPSPAAEPQPAPLATLGLWAEGVWLAVTDRDGSYHGRLAYEGTFQRFHPLMDHEYGLDVWTGLFSGSEDARWVHEVRGLRASAASISHATVLNVAEVRELTSVAGSVAMSFEYFREHSLTARRDYPRLALVWRSALGSSWTLGSSVGMHAFKASADVELFAATQWQEGAEARWNVKAGLTFLDLFNDVVFVGLGVEPILAETQFDYAGVPLGVRTALVRTTPATRVELHGGTTARTRVEVSFPGAGEPPFTLAERVTYAGILAEGHFSRAFSVAAYGTVARADTERRYSFAGRPELEVREETRTAGVRARVPLAPALRVEADLLATWRPEERTGRASGPLRHDDREVSAQLALLRRPRAGWLWLLAAAATDREAGVLARHLAAADSRQIMEGGYRFASGFEVVAGVRWDLDDFARHPFDGAHLRISAVW